MKYWLATALAMALSACKPADVKSKSVKDRLEAGELVEFTKPGYRRPACSEKSRDWSKVNLENDGERARIIVGVQKAALNNGMNTCFRVGSAVSLDESESKGQARVVKLGVRKLERLEAKDLGGEYFSQASAFGDYKDKAKKGLTDRDEGYVTIVHLEYLPNSAVDEKELSEKIAREGETDGLVETSKDGDLVSTCDRKWTELLAPDEFHEDLVHGKLRSFYRSGDLNCLAQGQLAEVKTKIGDPSKGIVHVLKVRKFRTSHLDARYFASPEDFARLEPVIRSDRSKKEWMTVMLVEPKDPPVVERCAYHPSSIPIVFPEAKPEILSAATWTAKLRGKTCYEIGELVTVQLIFSDHMTNVSVPAKVSSQVTEGDGSVVVLENLGVAK